MNKRHNQLGYTLIELMIAVTISAIMMAAAAAQLMQSRNVYVLQEADSRIEENGRYALEILTDQLRLAGYSDTTPTAEEEAPEAPFLFFDKCDGVCTRNGIDADNFSDSIAIWVNPPNDESCAGIAVPVSNATPTIANQFYIETTDGVGTLKCKTYLVEASTDVGLNFEDNNAIYVYGSDQALVEGIENMQILYGIADLDGDDPRPLRYVSADTINNLGGISDTERTWKKVSSVKIVLLVGTGFNDQADTVGTRSYQMADADPITYDDGNRRKVFSSTVILNNAKL